MLPFGPQNQLAGHRQTQAGGGAGPAIAFCGPSNAWKGAHVTKSYERLAWAIRLPLSQPLPKPLAVRPCVLQRQCRRPQRRLLWLE
jgi:hypothetical protein